MEDEIKEILQRSMRYLNDIFYGIEENKNKSCFYTTWRKQRSSIMMNCMSRKGENAKESNNNMMKVMCMEMMGCNTGESEESCSCNCCGPDENESESTEPENGEK